MVTGDCGQIIPRLLPGPVGRWIAAVNRWSGRTCRYCDPRNSR